MSKLKTQQILTTDDEISDPGHSFFSKFVFVNVVIEKL